MKKIIILLAFILLATTVFAEIIEKQLTFQIPKIENAGQYQRIISDDMFSIVKPGYPEIPSKGIQILLPAGESIKSIKIVQQENSIIEGEFDVIPFQALLPMSFQGEIEFNEPNSAIYNSNEFFPQKQIVDTNTQYFRGHSIAMFNIYPIQYNPVTKKIQYSTNITILLETEITSASQRAFNSFYRSEAMTIKRIENIVSNPEYLSNYPQPVELRNETFDYIIITSDSYSNSFNDFVSFKLEQGFNVFLKTTNDIYSEYTGTDNQEKIRNFIIDAYQNMGAEYVLLGGDVSVVPHRGFWVNNFFEDYGIPSDLYYAALDRVGTGTGPDWNVNNNNKWGEASEADYLGEVYVGRISADTTTELIAALNKQIMYQDNPVIGDLDKALMVGEEMDNQTYGGDYKDEIITGGSFNGYYTEGIDSNMNIETLYDRDLNWNENQLLDLMNSGLNILNHLGHSHIDYNMKMDMSSVNNTNITANGTNHNFFIIYSQGCLPAAIDEDCIAEKFTTIDNGCVVYVGNSRYGWYQPGGTNACSQFFDRQFFDATFGEDIYTVGMMNADSKEDGAPQCSDATFRWGYYEVNVLGDPSLDVRTAVPQDMTAIYNPSIAVGVSNIQFQTDAPYARVALIQNNELIGNGVADVNGNVTATTFEPIAVTETISVSIIGHNKNRHSGEIVVEYQAYVILDSVEIDDSAGNNNNLPDFGETLGLNVRLQNVGTIEATDVSATISTDDDYVTITQASSNYNNIPSGGSSNAQTDYEVTIADNCPDGHTASFTVNVTSNEDNWELYFTLELNAPVIEFYSVFIDDGLNNVLDPDETADIYVSFMNSGGADAANVLTELFESDPYITLNTQAHTFTLLNAGNISTCIFNVTAASTTPIGHIASIDWEMNGDISYHAEGTLNLLISQASVNLEEDFSAGYPPAGWTRTGLNPNNWTGYPSNEAGGIAPESRLLSSPYFVGVSRLVSPVINTTGSTSIDLEFRQYLRTVSVNDYSVSVRTSSDGGDTWNTAWEAIPPTAPFYDELIQVTVSTPDVGSDNFQFAFVFDGISERIRRWCIDNIHLAGEQITYFGFIEGEISLDGGTGNVEDVIVTGGNYSASPNASGDYYLPLAVGTYDVVASLESYETMMEIDVVIAPNQTEIIDFELTYQPVSEDEETIVPAITTLSRNYPNPFNPTTTISYSLKENSKVSFNIYNLKGQLVKKLVDEDMNAGFHNVVWNGKNESGRNVSSGIYFYKLQSDSFEQTKKMILIK